MATNLGARASNARLPLGYPSRSFANYDGQTNWPPNNAGMTLDAFGKCATQTFNRPERFVLKVGATTICRVAAGQGFARYDMKLQLAVGSNYVNDLNGYCVFQKANWVVGTIDNNWKGTTIEGIWLCEANTPYYVNFLSGWDVAPGYVYYYRHPFYMNLWAYTFGEGAY